jgi:hypothetical protein
MMAFDAKHILRFSEVEQWALPDAGTMRLVPACVPGDAIGLDRECHHRRSRVLTALRTKAMEIDQVLIFRSWEQG